MYMCMGTAVVMVLQCCLVAVFLVVCVQSTPTSVRTTPLDELEQVLKNLNDVIAKRDLWGVGLPPVSGSDLINSFKYNFSSGHVASFSTLALRGEGQYLSRTDSADSSDVYYDLVLGLDQLNIQYLFSISYFYIFSETGVIHLANDNNFAVHVKGAVNKSKDGCFGFLESAEVRQFGDFGVTIVPSSLTRRVVEFLSQKSINLVLPLFKSLINDIIQVNVDQKVPSSDFSQIVCEAVFQ